MNRQDVEKAAQVGDELIHKLLAAGAEQFSYVTASIAEISDYGVWIVVNVAVDGVSPRLYNLKLDAIKADDTHYTSSHIDLLVASTIENMKDMLNRYNVVHGVEEQ